MNNKKYLFFSIFAILVVILVFQIYRVSAQTSGGRIIFGGSSSTSLTASAVCDPNGNVCHATQTSRLGLRVPFALTLKNLYAAQANAPSGSSSCGFYLRRSVNCTDPYTSIGLSCLISAGQKTCSNTNATAQVSAGDCLQVNFVEVGTCSGFANWGFEGAF